MKKRMMVITLLLAIAGFSQAQVFMMGDGDSPREDIGSVPFVPGHDADWDQGEGYTPVGGGAALLVGFGAAYLMAKKRKK